jgi:galactose-1-phosphate uridylyltransferase
VVDKLQVILISPGDVGPERDAMASILSRMRDVSLFRYEVNVAPIVGTGPIQPLIDKKARISERHVVIAIFGRRVGTPVEPDGITGTQHELAAALKGSALRGLPKVMLYFKPGDLTADDPLDLRQYAGLLDFRARLGLNAAEYAEYSNIKDLRSKFPEHFSVVRKLVEEELRRLATTETRFEDQVTRVAPENLQELVVPGPGRLYSSFNPRKSRRPFCRIQVYTTPGCVPDRAAPDDRAKDLTTQHTINLIRDPIRPFEIQIGAFRASRFGKEPREVPFEGLPNTRELMRLYPLLQGPEHRWLRIVLAELINDPVGLKEMHTHETQSEIKDLIARNPSAPNSVRQDHCRFCNGLFQIKRMVAEENQTIMIANDFPFGPFCHYIVFPKGPVHSWESIKAHDLHEMNYLVWKHFTVEGAKSADHSRSVDTAKLRGAAGIRMGFNSSIRHLVLGHRTRTSAGASIAHVHKQIWGMTRDSVNLADHLNEVCLAYDKLGVDYLAKYLEAIDAAGLKIWEDENVVLYVPFGQISLDELQIMVKKRKKPTLLWLDEAEIASFSQAEFAVTRLFDRMEINSFNEVILGLPEDTLHSDSFRLIWTFITREVDLAVSELNLLYVVDRHPYNTVEKVDKIWPGPPEDRRIESLDVRDAEGGAAPIAGSAAGRKRGPTNGRSRPARRSGRPLAKER